MKNDLSYKRRFEYKEGKSNKFWEAHIDVSPNGEYYTFSTRYGRIGSEGLMSANLAFDVYTKAVAYAEKKCTEKKRKGYREVDFVTAPVKVKSYSEKILDGLTLYWKYALDVLFPVDDLTQISRSSWPLYISKATGKISIDKSRPGYDSVLLLRMRNGSETRDFILTASDINGYVCALYSFTGMYGSTNQMVMGSFEPRTKTHVINFLSDSYNYYENDKFYHIFPFLELSPDNSYYPKLPTGEPYRPIPIPARLEAMAQAGDDDYDYDEVSLSEAIAAEDRAITGQAARRILVQPKRKVII